MEIALDMLVPQSSALAMNSTKRSSGSVKSWSFDFTLLLLGLLANLVETHKTNRLAFGKLKKKKSCQLVVDVFLRTLPEEIVKALKDVKKHNTGKYICSIISQCNIYVMQVLISTGIPSSL